MKKMKLKENLKYLRESNNLTVQEMSDLLGANHRATYYSWETGQSNPSIKKLVDISNVFKISMDLLVKKELKKD